MLSDLEFQSWCEKNNLSKKTQDYINKNIRFSQPARSVGEGNQSLSGKYPSKKMGLSIQWESGKIEKPAVLMLENDEDVLEYYDQPNKIKLSFIDDLGKNRGTLYTPDFFVIRKNGAAWEEWKTEEDLNKITKKQFWKFKIGEDGKWSCPPGKEFAKELGLDFKVWTSKQINWNLHRNSIFLDDYLRRKKSLNIDEKSLTEIKQVVFQKPGLTLKTLIEESENKAYSADDIYVSIIKQHLHVNLSEAALAESHLVKVFLHKEHEKMYSNLINCNRELEQPLMTSFNIGKEILWDDHIWKIINIGNSNVSIISENKFNEIPIPLFNELIHNGTIVGKQEICNETNSPIDLITGATEEDYKVANYRINFVREYLEYGSKKFQTSKEPNLRKVRDWVKKYREAEILFGNGYVGLLPNDKNKGNRRTRFPQEVLDLMDHFIKEEYETLIQKNKTVVYGSFKSACEEKGFLPPSLVTFSKYVNERPIELQTKNRKGKRAEYQTKTFYWELERTTPRHGDFPFNICHLDHTELDIELISSRTGKNLGRPYLSLLVDAYSRRILAFYLSFEPPSYRSCLMVFRDCVRRFNRLPQQIVVDNGKEFHSIYFESLLAMYEREIQRRPSAKPRYGSILERLFGMTNTRFIHNLIGNTKIMKNVREVTKSVNPKSHATWNLIDLSLALEEFFFDFYDTIEHPTLEQTPREAFKKGLFYSGERKDFHIAYDRLFEILTLPSTSSGEATIQNSGVKINYLYYWNDEFKSIHFKKMKIKVRFDPFNIGIAYAYVNKRWVKCISQYYSTFSNITQKELKYITAEMKKSKENHSKSYTITAQRIANFINKLEDDDKYKALKEKVYETKNVIYTNFNKTINKPIDNDLLTDNKIEQNNKFEIDETEQILEIYGDF